VSPKCDILEFHLATPTAFQHLSVLNAVSPTKELTKWDATTKWSTSTLDGTRARLATSGSIKYPTWRNTCPIVDYAPLMRILSIVSSLKDPGITRALHVRFLQLLEYTLVLVWLPFRPIHSVLTKLTFYAIIRYQCKTFKLNFSMKYYWSDNLWTFDFSSDKFGVA